MSKASEWATRALGSKPVLFGEDPSSGNRKRVAEVAVWLPTYQPYCHLWSDQLGPTEAVELARWILDTFREPPCDPS